jgi:hypothetical protein
MPQADARARGHHGDLWRPGKARPMAGLHFGSDGRATAAKRERARSTLGTRVRTLARALAESASFGHEES